MSIYFYFLLTVFGIIGWMMIVDANVASYIDLQYQRVYIFFARRYLMIKLHPRNPITNWMFNRKLKKLMKELEEERDND